MDIRREDFYCGTFLSVLLNNGIVPALFEERVEPNRKIYDFKTDKGDFRVYVKFTEKPSSESVSKGSCIWNFSFTESQIDEMKKIEEDNRNLYFAFICGQKALNKSKIAVVPKEIIFQCIDIDRIQKYKSQSVKIKLIKSQRDFNIYGTARADKENGKDNTLSVRANNVEEIFGRGI